jgi:hypothetical protein
MKRTHAVFGALLLLACTAATAEIYKWKDADGQMRYSDKPPPASVPPQNIQNRGRAEHTIEIQNENPT